jgi:hypothetical protein
VDNLGGYLVGRVGDRGPFVVRLFGADHYGRVVLLLWEVDADAALAALGCRVYVVASEVHRITRQNDTWKGMVQLDSETHRPYRPRESSPVRKASKPRKS